MLHRIIRGHIHQRRFILTALVACNMPQQSHYQFLHDGIQLAGLKQRPVTVVNIMMMAYSVVCQVQERQQAQPLDDPDVLARKAANLDQQRSRFRRALGAQEDVDEIEPAFAV